jgi:hypothetical protein
MEFCRRQLRPWQKETEAIYYKERRKEQKASILLKGDAIKIFTFGNLLCVSNE